MRTTAFLLLSCIALTKSTAAGQDYAASQPAAKKPPASALAEKPGPKFTGLRYLEDFTYLDGPPGSYKKDFFDPIKNIHLDKDWTLRLGGEIRFRMETDNNRNFGNRDPSQDTYLLQRELLHANLTYRKTLRFYVEGIDATVIDRDLAPSPGHENRFDLNQAFFDYRIGGDDSPWVIRSGRQSMRYARERVLGMGDWGNATRAFDGFKLLYQTKDLDVDFFWLRPIELTVTPYVNVLEPPIDEGLNRKPNHYREQQQFWGTYAVYRGIKNHQIEGYAFGLHDNWKYVNANGNPGDITLYTIGGRASGTFGAFDYDVEGAGQWGSFAGADVHAWMLGTEAGYTFKDVPWTPRIGPGFDFATGDDSPGDNSHETYTQLYPTAHSVLGYIDLFGRQNVLAPNLHLTLKPLKDLTVRLFYYHFWLDSATDALYSTRGNISRRSTGAIAGKDVGDEFDITVGYQVDPHNSLLLGYTHFWSDNFVARTGRSRDPDMVYLQWVFRF